MVILCSEYRKHSNNQNPGRLISWSAPKRYDIKELVTRVVYYVTQKIKDCYSIDTSPYTYPCIMICSSADGCILWEALIRFYSSLWLPDWPKQKPISQKRALIATRLVDLCIEYLVYVTLPAMSINCIFGLQWPHDRLILMAVSFLSPVNIQTLKN